MNPDDKLLRLTVTDYLRRRFRLFPGEGLFVHNDLCGICNAESWCMYLVFQLPTGEIGQAASCATCLRHCAASMDEHPSLADLYEKGEHSWSAVKEW